MRIDQYVPDKPIPSSIAIFRIGFFVLLASSAGCELFFARADLNETSGIWHGRPSTTTLIGGDREYEAVEFVLDTDRRRDLDWLSSDENPVLVDGYRVPLHASEFETDQRIRLDGTIRWAWVLRPEHRLTGGGCERVILKRPGSDDPLVLVLIVEPRYPRTPIHADYYDTYVDQ